MEAVNEDALDFARETADDEADYSIGRNSSR